MARTMSIEDINAGILGLSTDLRREVAAALFWSLPRDDLIELHGKISQMLQKDIVGLLPPELSVRILSLLDADTLLTCRLVSKTWLGMCDDQGVWINLCRSHIPPIIPAQTTWNDISVHAQLRHSGRPLPPPMTSFGDESFESASDDERTIGRSTLFPRANGDSNWSPTTNGSPDKTIWNASVDYLPTHHCSLPGDNPTQPQIPALSTSLEYLPILSHLHAPTPLPRPNYKHLYLIRRILAWRMKDKRPSDVYPALNPSRVATGKWNPRVFILSSLSSSNAGGLPGHTESIYSLHLFRHSMKISVPSSDYCDDLLDRRWVTPKARDGPGADIFGALPPASWWPGGSNGGRNPSRATHTGSSIVSGRDWLLSGSRDHTLRLWQIACPAPRVVKVFSGGHNGSVLSHFVVEIAIPQPKNSSSRPHYRSPSKSPISSYSGSASCDVPRKRIVAVSGGSDGRICLWDIENGDGTAENVIEAHEDSVLYVRGDDERIVSCSKDRTIKVFNIQTLEQQFVISNVEEGHRGAVNAVGLTKDFIISASGDRTIKLWDVNDGHLLASIDAHVRGISSISFEPFASPLSGWQPEVLGSILRGTIIAGSTDSSIKTFHIVQFPQGKLPPSHDETFTFRDMLELEREGDMEADGFRPRISIQPGVEYRALCSCPNSAHRSASGCTRCHNRGHTDLVRSLHLGEEIALSSSYDSTVKIWDRTTGRLIFDFEGCHSGRVFSVTGDRTRVVSSGLDARIAIVDFSEGLDTAFV